MRNVLQYIYLHVSVIRIEVLLCLSQHATITCKRKYNCMTTKLT
jgi:hypothetical protein